MERNHVWKKLTEEMCESVAYPLVEIVGTKRILIEHHNGILGYQPDCICIRMGYGMLKICGKDLRFLQISGQQLVITGKILTISLATS